VSGARIRGQDLRMSRRFRAAAMAATRRAAWLAVLLAIGVASGPAQALEDGTSSYPRGYRDLAAGLLPADAGVYVRDDLNFYRGTLDEMQQNDTVSLHAELGLIANVSRATIVTGWRPLGLTQAFGISWVQTGSTLDARFVTPGGTLRPDEQTVGVGDLAVTPVLLGWDEGNWHGNAGLAIWIPIGSYQADRFINPGRNYWSFGSHVALSWLDAQSGWDVSVAALYVTNLENPATDYDSGDVLHVNAYAGKRVAPWLTLGVAGYTLQQVTGDSGSGATLGDFRARVYGLGPAFRFGIDVGDAELPLLLKYYREFGAENTFEGDLVSIGTSFRF
jgi:hypothetical protein